MTADVNTPIPSRPYSRLKGSEPSVTTIIGELAIPGLSWGAAKETARYVVLGDDKWTSMDEKKAIDHLRMHHKGVWDGRAAMGTLLHSVNEAWIKGETPDLAKLVGAVSSWKGREAEKIVEADGYVAGLAKFWEDFQPTRSYTEQVVRTPSSYIGTGDWWTMLRGECWYIDIKTTAEQDAEKGLYGDSWGLQCAALTAAREMITYKRDEKGKLYVASTEPNIPVDHCGVVHLRGDGDYMLYEVDAGVDMYDAFLSLLHLYEWRKQVKPPRPVNLKLEIPV